MTIDSSGRKHRRLEDVLPGGLAARRGSMGVYGSLSGVGWIALAVIVFMALVALKEALG